MRAGGQPSLHAWRMASICMALTCIASTCMAHTDPAGRTWRGRTTKNSQSFLTRSSSLMASYRIGCT